MNIKKLLIGGIAGGIVFFLLGWLVYGTLLTDFMRHNPGKIGLTGRNEPDYLYLIIGQLLYGFLLAYIFLKANVSSIAGGIVMGAVVGGLMAAAVDFTMYGTTIILSKKVVLADVVVAAVMAAIAGAVIAAVTGKKS